MLDLLMFVKPSTRLDPTLRKIVLAAFDDAIASIGDREYEYIEKRCLRKIDSLASSRTSWVRDLADVELSPSRRRLYKLSVRVSSM